MSSAKGEAAPKQDGEDIYTIMPVHGALGHLFLSILCTEAFPFQNLSWLCRAKGLSKGLHHCHLCRGPEGGEGVTVRGLGLGIFLLPPHSMEGGLSTRKELACIE